MKTCNQRVRVLEELWYIQVFDAQESNKTKMVSENVRIFRRSFFWIGEDTRADVYEQDPRQIGEGQLAKSTREQMYHTGKSFIYESDVKQILTFYPTSLLFS